MAVGRGWGRIVLIDKTASTIYLLRQLFSPSLQSPTSTRRRRLSSHYSLQAWRLSQPNISVWGETDTLGLRIGMSSRVCSPLVRTIMSPCGILWYGPLNSKACCRANGSLRMIRTRVCMLSSWAIPTKLASSDFTPAPPQGRSSSLPAQSIVRLKYGNKKNVTRATTTKWLPSMAMKEA